MNVNFIIRYFHVAILMAITATISAVWADSISINLTEGDSATMDTGYTFGAYPVDGQYWNIGIGNWGSISNLKSQSGTTSSTLNWNSSSTYRGGITFNSQTNAALLKAYLDDGNGYNTTITVSDVPYAFYDVYLYSASDADNKQYHANWINGLQYSGITGTTELGSSPWGLTNPTDQLAEATNYLKVTNQSSPTMTVHSGGNNTGSIRGSLAGVQIVNTTPDDFSIQNISTSTSTIEASTVNANNGINITDISGDATFTINGTLSLTPNATNNSTLISAQAGTSAITFNGNMNFSGENNVITTRGNTFNLNGNVSGSGLMTINGNVNTGTDSDLSGFTGGYQIGEGATFQANYKSDVTLTQSVSGPGTYVKTGSGNVTLTAANNHSLAKMDIQAGTLTVEGSADLGTSGYAVSVAKNATLGFNNITASDGLTVSNPISGEGNVVKSGTGTVILTGNNTYSGTTTLLGGTLRLMGTSTLGTGAKTIGSGATLSIARTDNTNIDNTYTFESGSTLAVASNTVVDSSISLNGSSISVASDVSLTKSDGSDWNHTVTSGQTYTKGMFIFSNTKDMTVSGADLGGTSTLNLSGGTLNLATSTQMPIVSGLQARFDASQAGSVQTDADGNVTAWLDSSGNGNNAYLANGTITTGSLNGKTTVDFADDGYSYLQFNRISDIRTVLWVAKDGASTSSAFLLGDSNWWNFHRGGNGEIWSWGDSVPAQHGTTTVDGKDASYNTVLNKQWQLITTATDTNMSANAISMDRSGSCGNRAWTGEMGEILIFNQQLSSNQIADLGIYLQNKWGLETAYKGLFSSPTTNLNVTSDSKIDVGTYTTVDLGTTTIASGKQFTIDVSEDQTTSWSGAIAGEGDVVKTGTGTITFSGANTYSGSTIVSGGTLRVTDDTVLGTGSKIINNGTLEIAKTSDVTIDSTYQFNKGSTLSTKTNVSIDPSVSLENTSVQIASDKTFTKSDGSDWDITIGANNTYTKGMASFSSDTGLNVTGSDLGGATTLTLSGGTLSLGTSTQSPISSGLVAHYDASDPNSVMTDSNGNVTGWLDSSGNGYNAGATGTITTSSTNGLTTIDFSNEGNSYFSMDRIGDIHTVIWVAKDDTSPSQAFLLGDPYSYDFHRGDNGSIWSGYGTAYGGSTTIDGQKVGSDTVLNKEWQLISVATDDGMVASSISADRNNQYGARSWTGEMGEILIFNEKLSDSQIRDIGIYLQEKWGLNTAYKGLFSSESTTLDVTTDSAINVSDRTAINVGTTTVAEGATLDIVVPNADQQTTWNTSITGAGSLKKSGDGELRMNFTTLGLTTDISVDGGKLVLFSNVYETHYNKGNVSVNNGATLGFECQDTEHQLWIDNPLTITLGEEGENTFSVNNNTSADMNFVVNSDFTIESKGGATNYVTSTGDRFGINLHSHGITFDVAKGTDENNNDLIVSARILNPYGVTKKGSGTMVITNSTNNYSGGTNIKEGTLKVDGNGSLGSGTVSVDSGATLEYYTTESKTPSFAAYWILGDGTLKFSGNATNSSHFDLTSSNLSTFNGNVVIDGARVMISETQDIGKESTSIAVKSGGQLFIPTESTLSLNVTIAGTGVSEADGYLGALRLDQSTLNGTIALSDDASIRAYIGSYSTINSTIDLAGNTLTFGNGNLIVLNGVISDSSTEATGSVTYSTTNWFDIHGENTYTGGTTLQSGKAVAYTDSAFGSGTITLSGGTLGQSGARTFTNNIEVVADTSSVIETGDNMTLTGKLSGSGTVTRQGNSTLFLKGDNSAFAGTFNAKEANTYFSSFDAGSAKAEWQVNATVSNYVTGNGTIELGALSGSGTLRNDVDGLVTFQIGALNKSTEFSGTIQDNYGGQSDTQQVKLEKVGTGTLTLSGSNIYSGGTDIQAGTIKLDGSGSLGYGEVRIASDALLTGDTWGEFAPTSIVLNGGTLNTTDNSPTSNFRFANSGSTISVAESGKTGTHTGGINLNGQTVNYSAVKDSTLDIQARVWNGGQLNVSGEGTVNLANLNFRDGGYNTASSVTSTAFKLNAAGALDRTDNTNMFDLQNGIFSPGKFNNDIGTFTVGAVSNDTGNSVFTVGATSNSTGNGTFKTANGTTLLFDFGETPDDGNDLLVVNGTLDLAENTIFALSFADESAWLVPEASYKLVDTDFPEGDLSSYLAPEHQSNWDLISTGYGIFLNASSQDTSVPEPSTWMLLILGFAGLMKVTSCELRVARKCKKP